MQNPPRHSSQRQNIPQQNPPRHSSQPQGAPRQNPARQPSARQGASRPNPARSTPPRQGAPRRRRLTPAQRRMRWIRKNKTLLIIAAAALIALIILLFALPGGSKKTADVSVSGSQELTVTAAPETADTSSDASAADTQSADSVESETDLSADSQDTAAAVDGASPTAIASQTTSQEVAATENFDFETAYVQALNGTVTGPEITPDYSKVDPDYLNRWKMPEENRMPVLYTAQNVTEKVICITVDDCYQPENLRQIVQCALDNGQTLTVFPIGENMEKLSNLREIIKWAWENGVEMENHTYTHNGLYHYDDDRMREEIWKQARELEQVLGVNYTQHFFRPHGGDERDDQRMQAYCNQLGFNAIAVWTMSGSSSSLEASEKALAPGNVYLFHTTDKDTNTLLQFIPYCVSQGYKLITLNQMYGLPDNETSPLTTSVDDPAPAFKSFKVDPVSLKKTSYCRAAAVVQKRLIELGWMDGEADGEFGNASYMATGFYQLAAGLKANGVASVETQVSLFSDNAEVGSEERIAELKKSIGK